jgi:endonuclease/exonuclease/phosphatase (EEP) superfamily protein YafD
MRFRLFDRKRRMAAPFGSLSPGGGISKAVFLRIGDTFAFVIGLSCGLAALASNGGFFSNRLDLVAQFTAVWLGGGGLVAFYGICRAFASRRWAIAVLGFAGVLAGLPLVIPELTRPIRPSLQTATGYRLKLIEYNAWERNPHITADAEWLARQNPDLVLMADADDSAIRAMAARGFLCTRGVADTVIFSRVLPARESITIPGSDWPNLPSFSRATFVAAGSDFTVIATHLKRPISSPHREQREALLRLIGRYDRRHLILAGDFNDTPWSFGLRKLDQQLGLERRDRALSTWPANYSPVAFLPIDHVYAGTAWRTVSIARGPQLGSDHYPVVVTLALAS